LKDNDFWVLQQCIHPKLLVISCPQHYWAGDGWISGYSSSGEMENREENVGDIVSKMMLE